MKNIIITGASQGIGYSLAQKHLLAGHNVLVIARNENLLNTLKEIGRDNLICLVLDLTDENSFESIKKNITSWQTVDVVYNNAGLLINKPFSELTTDDFFQSWNVNFLACAKIIQLILPKCTIDSHIVNISSIGAVQGASKFSGLTAYASAKAALCNLTEMVAEEYKKTGPRCNCIALGAVQTEMLAKAFPGYKAPLTPVEMADYLFEFGINGYKYFNGKIIQASSTTP